MILAMWPYNDIDIRTAVKKDYRLFGRKSSRAMNLEPPPLHPLFSGSHQLRSATQRQFHTVLYEKRKHTNNWDNQETIFTAKSNVSARMFLSRNEVA